MKEMLTIVIPTYNEGLRLQQTITFFTTYFPNLPIVVVDDGSTDNSIALLPKTPKLQVIRHSKNLGKAAAIYSGLKKVRTEWLCLFDADLNNLNATELTSGFTTITTTKTDMVIFSQDLDSTIWKWLNLHIVLSGERCVRTKTLSSFFQQVQTAQYAFEIDLHHWFLEKKLQYDTCPLHCQNKLKIKKWSPVVALRKSIEFYLYLLFTTKRF